MDPLLIAHAGITCFLCGLIWTVQCVHYPLFARVGPEAFTAYGREHRTRIARVVAPAMLVELGLAGALLLRPGAPVPQWSTLLGAVLLLWIWAVTALGAVPRHRELERGFAAEAHRGLLRVNWQRTLAWSMRSALALWMLTFTETTP